MKDHADSTTPTGWKEVLVGEVATITSGIGFPLDEQGQASGELPFFKVSDVSYAVRFTGGSLVKANHYVSYAVANKLRGVQVDVGATAFAKIGEAVRLNRRAIVAVPCLIDNNVMSVKSYGQVTDRYLFHFLRTVDFSQTVRSTTVPSLRKGDIETLKLPMAPLAEQHRIADKLDAVVARVDACRDRLARVTPLLKRFRQSVLSAATSGRLTSDWGGRCMEPEGSVPARSPMVIFADEQDQLPAGWNWTRLTDLARLESGHTPRKSVAVYWDGGDVPWISLQDIRAADGRVISETKFSPTQAGIDNSSARLLPEGTVCFCRDISFGYVTIMGRSMATSQHFANWVCSPMLTPRYLMYSFMAGRDFLAMSGQGTTVTTIYMPALKELRLATPPIAEQAEIVRRVETLFAFADRLEARLTKAQAAADRLTPSLLAKAFRGELVPQDPADEPAAVLLQRLAASRPAPGAKVRRPRAGQVG